ncbi:hypothetical protein BGZ95_003239 [Linnemannia exigua]|uniref:Kinase-like protein n=1 Tax=Linnemannia exigua TaxID=604196 RepID=A0AAD4H2F1_9FUNG|nr:hypothetical protein BGZ95_003239 [Linnemannia exigua]
MQPPQEQGPSQFRVPDGPARRTQQQSGTGSSTKGGSPTIAESSSSSTATTSTRGSISSSAAKRATPTSPTFQATISPASQHKLRAIPQYVKPSASQVEQYDSTQTQLLGDYGHDLPDDEPQAEPEEVQSPYIGRLEGREETMHVYLPRSMESFKFGTAKYNDFIINHQHWPLESQEAQGSWFKLTWKPSATRPNQATTTIHDLSSMGLYVNRRPLGKGKSQILEWGDDIAGGPPGEELFKYVYMPIIGLETVKTERATYVLEDRPIGEGQYSKVRKARDTAHNDLVYACKVVNGLAPAYNESERASVAHEIRLLQELSHENIVKFVDVCSTGAMTYIFTELIEGETLLSYYHSHDHGLSELIARDIFRQTCDAVSYLHSYDVVHRDIKSENVMITPARVVKLIDFGLARRSTSTAILRTFCGTDAYMAPETAVNDNEDNGYGKAVGVMLFRMLAGSYPFDSRKSENGKAGSNHKDAPKETKSDSKENSTEKTNLVGVERQGAGAMHDVSRLPRHLRDWRPLVDDVRLRSNEVKDLLNKMLMVDPSKRIPISEVLRHDWVRMVDEELDKIEKSLAQHSLDSVVAPIREANTELWGMLSIIPGSVPDAPRRIGLWKDELLLGRDPYKVGVHLGNDRALSLVQCEIHYKDKVAMVVDRSENGTFINSFKIGLDRLGQIVDGDELGLIVPLDPTLLPDPRDRINRYLKYKVNIYNSTPTTEDLVRRRYDAVDKSGSNTERRNIRKVESLDIPPTDDWPPVEGAWGRLEPINSESAKETLSLKKIVIGRWEDCVFEWNEEHQAAYLSSKGQNIIKVNGSRVQGYVQLRDDDVIHLFSSSAYLPPSKRIKEEK